MREAGMTVTEDALGTVRGHWRPELKKRLLIGSHIDTVIDAGRYDGPLGVVAGILAVRELAARNVDLPFGIDVLAFGDEEGSRFRTTLAGSSACAGVFDRSSLAFPDRNGVSLADAIRPMARASMIFRRRPTTPRDVVGYVEVHIEQGPVLEAQSLPLGVVTGIVGQSRMRVVVLGEAGHAGTVPMHMRHDALVGAAELMLLIEQTALENRGRRHGGDRRSHRGVARRDQCHTRSGRLLAGISLVERRQAKGCDRADQGRRATDRRQTAARICLRAVP